VFKERHGPWLPVECGHVCGDVAVSPHHITSQADDVLHIAIRQGKTVGRQNRNVKSPKKMAGELASINSNRALS